MRLIDQIIASRGGPMDDATLGAFSAVASSAARAECFDIGPGVADLCLRVSQSKPTSLVSALAYARAPYATTWLEWAPPSLGRYDLRDGTERQRRIGCLIVHEAGGSSGSVMQMTFAWQSADGQVVNICPIAVRFDQEGDAKVGAPPQPAMTEADAPAALAASSDWRRLESDERECRALVELERHFALFDCSYTSDFIRRAGELVPDKARELLSMAHEDLTGEPSFVVAFLVLLHTRNAPVRREREDLSRLNKQREKRRREPLREFIVTRLSIERRPSEEAGAAVRAPSRQHLVMGHFKVRKTGCFWWSPYVRGDAARGVALRERYEVRP